MASQSLVSQHGQDAPDPATHGDGDGDGDDDENFWLDPECYVIPSKRVQIAWKDEVAYWQWKPQPGSWSHECACLNDVCWLDVKAEAKDMVFCPGIYTASFRIMLINPSGFRNHPVCLLLDTSDGQHAEAERFLEGDQLRCGTVAPLRPVGGGWLDLDAGEFSVDTETPLTVSFSLRGVEGEWWKSGLVVDCAKIQLSSAIQRG